LTFYGYLLERQEVVFRAAREWLGACQAALATRPKGPLVDLAALGEALPAGEVRCFIEDVRPRATPVLGQLASRLAAENDGLERALRLFARGEPLDELSEQLGCAPVALEFFPRAFMEPVAEAALHMVSAAAQRGSTVVSAIAGATRCPWCGWRPQVSVLADDSEIRGRRRLICGLCHGEWAYPRATCPGCGEADATKLTHHVSEKWPHVRIEACAGCGAYLKAVDLRADGMAVPIVDDVASVELDLWADEHGLKKLQRNLLGL